MLTVDAECSQPTQVAEHPRPLAGVSHDRPTFEQIVEREQPGVAQLAQRLLGWSTDRQDVDDVVQDVFLAVLKGLSSFRERSSVSTWVTRITINACRSQRRRRLVRAALWDRWVRRAPTAHGPDSAAAESDETQRCVRQAIARLPNRYREAVVLRYLHEMGIDEMGEVLGLTRSAIEVRLHRAREMLKTELGELAEPRR